MFNLRVNDELELALQYENRVEEAFALIMANYEHIHEWSSWLNEDFTLEKAREFCKQHEKNFANGDGDIGLRIIYQGKIAGATGFHEINRKDKSAEIGYWLAKEFTGKGLATKSIAKLLEYGFDDLQLNRIVIKCVPENVKSRAIPEKLGFVQEGIEREGGWLHIRFVDHIVYSMLVKEWKNRNS
jgi:ribosomal-protein-serine acetyltransferase